MKDVDKGHLEIASILAMASIILIMVLFISDCDWGKVYEPPPPPTQGTFFYQWARDYTTDQLMSEPAKLEEFIIRFINEEANFNKPGIGYNGTNGCTYDGTTLDYKSGEPVGAPRSWSAPSKESLQVTILSLAIAGNNYAQSFVSPYNPSNAPSMAVDILRKKIATYEKFDTEYPGFGGFLPWFQANSDDRIVPTSDWEDSVPALDNGQLAWSLFLAADVLQQNGINDLADHYRSRWQIMANNAVMIFLEQDNKIRAESKIINLHTTPIPSNYTNNKADYFLNDPYEGELMAVFMSLFGTWPDPGTQIQQLWADKETKLQSTSYQTNSGRNITVRQGHWYSSHEMWNFMVLPYTDDPLINRLMINGEKARTWYSAENRYPGLFASVNPPQNESGVSITGKDYISDAGIPSLATELVTVQNVVTPYASFPVILSDRKIGAVWLCTMLCGPKMQGPYGASESITTDGKYIDPIKTQDGTLPTIIALTGASTQLMHDALVRAGKYTQFRELVGNEYSHKFSSLEGEDLPFKIPTAYIPLGSIDFETYTGDVITDVLKGTAFYGGGNLVDTFTFSNGILHLPVDSGYIWNGILVTNAKTNHFINFTAKTTGGDSKGFYIEIKNNQDYLITPSRLRIEFPDTEANFKKFSIDINDLITSPNQTAAVFIFSDPDVAIDFTSVTFTPQAAINSELLVYDGHRFGSGLIPAIAANMPGGNLIGQVNFNRGGNISYSYGNTLKLIQSSGYLWANLPNPFKDISTNPVMYLLVKTSTECNFYLELKNAENKPIVGKTAYNNCNKVYISIPNTSNQYQLISVNLNDEILSSTQDNVAQVIAISDPSGIMEIAGMSLSQPG